MTTTEDKIKYLKEWGWVSEPHELGFNVYSHVRFPGMTFKLNAAYEKMKANEPKPILTARYDDPEAMEKVKDFTHRVMRIGKYTPKTDEEKIEELFNQILKKTSN